jgi:hypothetical protein
MTRSTDGFYCQSIFLLNKKGKEQRISTFGIREKHTEILAQSHHPSP